MMHELFMNVAYACGMAVAVAAAVVAVKFSFGYVVKRNDNKLPSSPKTYAMAPIESVQEILKHVSAGPPELRNKPMRASLPELPVEPEPLEPELPPEPEPEIECGNCKAVIRSQPVGGEARDGNVFVQIYECENCGSKVEV